MKKNTKKITFFSKASNKEAVKGIERNEMYQCEVRDSEVYQTNCSVRMRGESLGST